MALLVSKPISPSEHGNDSGPSERLAVTMVDEDFSALLRWASARGITDAPRIFPSRANGETSGGSEVIPCRMLGHCIRMATFPDAGGRGLAATRSLKQGELILRVPKSALMSMLSAKEDAQLAEAISLHPTLSSTQVLTVHLLSEVAKGKLSSWYEYLVELPRLHHTLAHFSPYAVQALQVEDARWVAVKAAKTSLMEWEMAKSFMQEIGLRRRFRSLNAWLWASATVSSRTLHVPWDEAGTLCPIGDLFNYAPPGELYLGAKHLEEQVSSNLNLAEESISLEIEFSCNEVTIGERLRDGGYESESGEYCFYARQAYNPGQQVLLCYGQYNNLELLEHYGFSMGQNPNDVVHLSLPDSSEFGSCSNHLPINSSGAPYIEVNGTPSFSLLAGLRLRSIQPSLRKAKAHLALTGQQISEESDVLVYQWLLRKCEMLLTSLPTSLGDDCALADLVSSASDLRQTETLSRTLCEGTERAGHVPMSEPIPGDDKLRRRILSELETFLRSSGVTMNVVETLEETKRDDSQLDRWRLALEWRIGYKRILYRCCVLCTRKIRTLITS